MKRLALTGLREWLNTRHRKPLVIRGARQVGKSTLVRLFASAEGYRLIEVNCEEHPELAPVFDTMDVEAILTEIELGLGLGSARADHTILFLDEIQAIPRAIQALRYFYEKLPSIPVIAAGSLLELALAKEKISVPVGRIEYFWLGPMMFREFLLAAGEEALVKYVDQVRIGSPVSEVIHVRLNRLVRQFFLTGGMPEVVRQYTETGIFGSTERVFNAMVQTLKDDLNKYAAGSQFHKAQLVFEYLSRGVGEKVKYVNISREASSALLEGAIQLLSMAGVVMRVHRTDANYPSRAGLSIRDYKLYALDIGILAFLSGVRSLSSEHLMHEESLAFINKGALAEQFVAQHLAYATGFFGEPQLQYWFREGKNLNAEVDFCMDFDGRVLPVEVKSGTSGSLKSVHQFCIEKNTAHAIRFDMNPPSHQKVTVVGRRNHENREVRFELLSVPLYLVERVGDLARECWM